METGNKQQSRKLLALPRQRENGNARTALLINEWLTRFAVNFDKDASAYVALWQEQFSGIEPDTLLSLFQCAMRTCKFFPKIAEILEPLKVIEERTLEEEWQALLDYCRLHVHPDIRFSDAPELPVEIDHAARAAGGVQFLRACSSEELGWRKKAFIEDLQRSRKTGDLAGLLTGGELRKLLKKAAAPVALLPDSIAYTPAIAAARVNLESAGETIARAKNKRITTRPSTLSLDEQKQILRQKGFLK